VRGSITSSKRDNDEMHIGPKGCWVGEGLKRRAAVFRRYKSVKPDPRYEGHPQKMKNSTGGIK